MWRGEAPIVKAPTPSTSSAPAASTSSAPRSSAPAASSADIVVILSTKTTPKTRPLTLEDLSEALDSFSEGKASKQEIFAKFEAVATPSASSSQASVSSSLSQRDVRVVDAARPHPSTSRRVVFQDASPNASSRRQSRRRSASPSPPRRRRQSGSPEDRHRRHSKRR